MMYPGIESKFLGKEKGEKPEFLSLEIAETQHKVCLSQCFKMKIGVLGTPQVVKNLKNCWSFCAKELEQI